MGGGVIVAKLLWITSQSFQRCSQWVDIAKVLQLGLCPLLQVTLSAENIEAEKIILDAILGFLDHMGASLTVNVYSTITLLSGKTNRILSHINS